MTTTTLLLAIWPAVVFAVAALMPPGRGTPSPLALARPHLIGWLFVMGFLMLFYT